MKKIMALFLVLAMATTFGTMSVLAADNENTLDDILNSSSATSSVESSVASSEVVEEEEKEVASSSMTEREQKDKNFMDNLAKASDLSAEAKGVEKATGGLQKVVAFLVQVIAYGVVILLSLRIVLDLAYIGLPFARKFLGNGYVGNAQIGAGPGAAQGGIGGMPGGIGGYGGRGMGGGMMGGMGSGMMGGMGSSMMGGMGGGMQGGQGGMGNEQAQMMGKIQWVSNAALNAVASENAITPEGKQRGPFKAYLKDVVVVLIAIPLILVLAVSGALTQVGFMLGELITGFLRNIGNMM